jgi:hypothetical protein
MKDKELLIVQTNNMIKRIINNDSKTLIILILSADKSL